MPCRCNNSRPNAKAEGIHCYMPRSRLLIWHRLRVPRFNYTLSNHKKKFDLNKVLKDSKFKTWRFDIQSNKFPSNSRPLSMSKSFVDGRIVGTSLVGVWKHVVSAVIFIFASYIYHMVNGQSSAHPTSCHKIVLTMTVSNVEVGMNILKMYKQQLDVFWFWFGSFDTLPLVHWFRFRLFGSKGQRHLSLEFCLHSDRDHRTAMLTYPLPHLSWTHSWGTAHSVRWRNSLKKTDCASRISHQYLMDIWHII